MKMVDIVKLLKDIVICWSEDNVSRLSAALAYYTIFALISLLIIFIAIAGLSFGEAAAQTQIIHQIKGYLGDNAASQIQLILQSAHKPKSGIITTIISIGVLILGSIGFFIELQQSLNTVSGTWNLKTFAGTSA